MLKDIDTVEDLNFLLENKVSEDIDLDYKSKLPNLSNDECRLEFLRDICSFANAQGGQIIYGIEELRKKATPEKIIGIDLPNPDNEIRRIQGIMRNGIEEAISGIILREIRLPDDKFCLVLKIPKSLNCPHRVKSNLDKDHRFYGRTSKEKYELSFYEIRNKFMQGSLIKEQIRKFREDRINAILKNDIPVEINSGPRIILHVIPFSAFDSNSEIDIGEIRKLYQKNVNDFSPLGFTDSIRNEITLDGFLTYPRNSKDGYVQFYREGIVEAVSVIPVSEYEDRLIHSGDYEKFILKQKYLKILEELNIVPPCCIFLSLIDINGFRLAVPSNNGMRDCYSPSARAFGKDRILLREIILESFDVALDKELKPCFDRLCNAWGFPECPHYQKDGNL